MDEFEVKVFQWSPADGLVYLDCHRWDAFCAGAEPLYRGAEYRGAEYRGAQHGRVDLLLLSIRSEVCELVDPISLQVDDNGYLRRLNVDMGPLPPSTNVRDARQRFVGRYLVHAGYWQPSEHLIGKALQLAEVEPLGNLTQRH